jgi:hypothetical protein
LFISFRQAKEFMMSEEAKVQCPACTAELTSGTVECPWCGHLISPKKDETLVDVILGSQSEVLELEPVTLPEEPAQLQEEIIAPEAIPEPAPESPMPDATVYPVSEPGLTELAPDVRLSPARNLKVMGIVLTIFSFLSLAYFIFQVLKGTLPQTILLLPIFGMMIGLISVAVAQRR